MSRIGKLPIAIPEGVTASLAEGVLSVKGPKGDLNMKIDKEIKALIGEKEIVFKADTKTKEVRTKYGMTRAIVASMVEGVDRGFEKKLEVVGVGYKVQKKGEGLELGLGFSHPVEVKPIEGVKIDIDPENKMTIVVTGIDKQKVGEMAAQIRAIKKPEPYKGKGIKYIDERIYRKAGKAAGAGA